MPPAHLSVLSQLDPEARLLLKTLVVGYIDPGTGSMLFALLVGAMSAAYFFFRKLLIRIRSLAPGGNRHKKSSERLPYVIFSDSKRYWNLFKPICDEFERRGVDLAYWTSSSDDPALVERYDHVHCEYIGEGNKAFARLNVMEADICLSTTPGLDVYQWKRSKATAWYVHIPHSIDGVSGYRMFGTDYFDALLLSGDFQAHEVRTLERLRELPAKEIEIVGCPYLDAMDGRLGQKNAPASRGCAEGADVPNACLCPTPSEAPGGDAARTHREAAPGKGDKPDGEDSPTVLLAPSWGDSAILAVYGERIIDALVDTHFDIVIRPHPQSLSSERELIDTLMRRYPDTDTLSWNFDNDNFEVLDQADIMITDFSGVIFDFALVFDKPVIYTTGHFDDAVYDAAWLDEPLWKFAIQEKLGVPLDETALSRLREVIVETVTSTAFREGRELARTQAWQHRGESARRTVDYLVRKHDALDKAKDPSDPAAS